MKNRFKKVLAGTLILALTTMYGGMVSTISATSDDDDEDTTTTSVTLDDDDESVSGTTSIIMVDTVLEGASAYNGHSYKLFDVAMSWNEAEKYCESQGGHLVTITSADEQQFVSSIASHSSKKNVWLGATKNSDGKYAWVTGEPAQFSNWSDGEPSNYNNSENCVMMYTYSNSLVSLGEWNDVASTGGTVSGFTIEDIGFICEWDFSNQTTTTTSVNSDSMTTTTTTMITDYKLDSEGNIVTDADGNPVVTNQDGNIIQNEQLNATTTTTEVTTKTPNLNISVITPQTSIVTTADTIGTSEVVTTIQDTSNSNIKYLYNGHTYQIFENMNLSWNNAKAYCTALGGHLVTITDRNEQDFINAIINNNPKPNLWIGAERNLDGSYSWVNGEDFLYNNWIDGEELNYSTDSDIAVVVQTYDTDENSPCGTWADISKDGGASSGYSIQEIGFICEWDEELEGAYQLADMGIEINNTSSDTTTTEDNSNPLIKYIVIGTLVVAVIVFMVATTLPKKEEK